MVQELNALLARTGIPLSDDLCPGGSTPLAAPCVRLRKVVENGPKSWDLKLC